MNQSTSHNGHKKTKKTEGHVEDRVEEQMQHAEEAVEHGVEAVRERMEHVKDIALDIRDRAQKTFEEKPYLVPIAAGAVGVGVGILLGSRISRFLVVAAAGTLLSDVVGTQVKRLGKELLAGLEEKLGEGLAEGSESTSTGKAGETATTS